MAYINQRKLDMMRQHAEHRYDAAFEKSMTMTSVGSASKEQMANALVQAYYQGVLKTIDIILEGGEITEWESGRI